MQRGPSSSRFFPAQRRPFMRRGSFIRRLLLIARHNKGPHLTMNHVYVFIFKIYLMYWIFFMTCICVIHQMCWFFHGWPGQAMAGPCSPRFVRGCQGRPWLVMVGHGWPGQAMACHCSPRFVRSSPQNRNNRMCVDAARAILQPFFSRPEASLYETGLLY